MLTITMKEEMRTAIAMTLPFVLGGFNVSHYERRPKSVSVCFTVIIVIRTCFIRLIYHYFSFCIQLMFNNY
jgi:hypothetical protein